VTEVSDILDAFLQQERLPPEYAESAVRFFVPLARHIETLKSRMPRPILVGVNGAQGSGKSTLATFLKRVLEARYGLRVAVLSIDDLYLTQGERRHLAQSVHPLMATRGVPGTHDVDLGIKVIDRLMTAGPEDVTPVPRFDKSMDDRLPEGQWDSFESRADIVILEGWCVGARSEDKTDLDAPINRLEAEEDWQGIWRTYVNRQLETVYPALFSRIDCLVMLKVPDFDCVRRWRLLQEEKLKARVARTAPGAGDAVMDPRSLERFIMHYERLTRHILAEMPARADAVLDLGHDHQVIHATGPLWDDPPSG
jgi:D-glycerate 3-kinase